MTTERAGEMPGELTDEHRVQLGYDPKGAVWMVTRSSVPGLYLQDRTLQGLVGKVNALAPQLIVDNLGHEAQAAPLHIDIPNSLEAPAAAR